MTIQLASRRCTALISSMLAIGIATLGTHARADEPPASTSSSAAVQVPLSVALELDLDLEQEALATELRAAIESELDRIVAEHELGRTDDAQAPLRVAVRLWQPEVVAVVIDSSITLDGRTIAALEGVVCMSCSVDELAKASLQALPEAIAEAQASRAEVEPPTPAPAPAPTPAPAGRGRALGPLGYVGIAASGLGLGGAIVGGVFLHRGRVLQGDPNAPVLTYTDHRPAGVALLGAGLGVMVVGNVLLGLDLGLLRPRRDQRERARAGLTGVGLGLGERSGLVVEGRF